MLRWTFNVVTVISLLLCVVSVVMWVRSYGVREGLSRGGNDEYGFALCDVVSFAGELTIGWNNSVEGWPDFPRPTCIHNTSIHETTL